MKFVVMVTSFHRSSNATSDTALPHDDKFLDACGEGSI